MPRLAVEIELDGLFAGLPPGTYRARFRYDPGAYAEQPEHWRPEAPLELGEHPVAIRAGPQPPAAGRAASGELPGPPAA